jgi:SAM-dependent methyltransferase
MIRLEAEDSPEAASERAAVMAGRLPARYGTPWQQPFLARIEPLLRPGVRILDVGSGARPVIAQRQRPGDCHYAGMDVSGHELGRAEPGAYDDVLVADVCSPGLADIEGRFDLVVSWQVLEHVTSMRAALATQYRALVPGGRMIAMLSGAWAFYALAARVIPFRASTGLQRRLLGVEPADKFPTRYDGCTDRALRSLLRAGGWRRCEIVPLYKGAGYLRFSQHLQRAYLRYENWAERRPCPNLATHYLVDAQR